MEPKIGRPLPLFEIEQAENHARLNFYQTLAEELSQFVTTATFDAAVVKVRKRLGY